MTEARSRANESGFMAITISCSSRRARKPSLLARIVYHVGKPWMLEGKRFFPQTGMPILKIARRMVLLAVELPEPFFVPTMIEKSLITLSMRLLIIVMSLRGAIVATKQHLHGHLVPVPPHP